MQKRYGEKDSALAFILAIVLPNVFAFLCILLLAFFIGIENVEKSLIYNYLSLIICQVAFLAIYFYVTIKGKVSFRAISHKKISIKQIILLLLISFCCLFFISPIINVFDELLVSFGIPKQGLSLDITKPINFVFYLFSAGILAPVCEELLFRGLILNGIEKQGKVRAVLISSLMFMLIHLNIHQTIYQFLLGGIFAIIVLNTDSIYSSIFVHIVNNCVVLLINYINPSLFSYKFLSPSYIVLAIVCLIIGLMCVYYLLKFLKSPSQNNKCVKNNEILEQSTQSSYLTKNFDYVNLSLISGIIIWILIIILTI